MSDSIQNYPLEKPKNVEEEVINSFLCYKTSQKNFFIFYSSFSFFWTFTLLSVLTYFFYLAPKFHIEIIIFAITFIYFVINILSICGYIKKKNYGFGINKLCAIKGMIISSLFASILGLLLMFIVIGSIIIPGKDKIGNFILFK